VYRLLSAAPCSPGNSIYRATIVAYLFDGGVATDTLAPRKLTVIVPRNKSDRDGFFVCRIDLGHRPAELLERHVH
jgi:hypothetical protein